MPRIESEPKILIGTDISIKKDKLTPKQKERLNKLKLKEEKELRKLYAACAPLKAKVFGRLIFDDVRSKEQVQQQLAGMKYSFSVGPWGIRRPSVAQFERVFDLLETIERNEIAEAELKKDNKQ